MKKGSPNRSILLASAALLAAMPQMAIAQDASASDTSDTSAERGIAEIVVTAQKREQQLSDVPVSITAASGEQLEKAGVNDVSDLPKLVAGLTYTPSLNSSPILTLRGIGFNEYTLGASPTVSVYVDQVPLPFLPMTRGTTFDLERVEVLKGPQGILFGQNSTGGAINYIAAKPTSTFQAGVDASYGRFDEVNAGGYISGPLSDTLSARLAVRTLQSGDWQQNFTRDDTQGSQDLLEGRFLLNWEPSTRTKIMLSVSGWRDKSDTPGAQLTGFRLQTPTNTARANLVLAQPLSPANARAANWNTSDPLNRDDRYFQVSLRGDFEMTDELTLTSITAYDDFKEDFSFDRDGTILTVIDIERSLGTIKDYTQELRIAGDMGRLNWVIGGNLMHAKVDSSLRIDVGQATNTLIGPFPFAISTSVFEQNIDEYAAFANAEFKLTDQLTATGGLRYTDSRREYEGCSTGDAGLSAGFTFLSGLVSGTPTPPIPVGACVTLGANGKPGLFRNTLEEDNLSWRGGLSFEPNDDILIYANVTKGYKSGSYPILSASLATQLLPVTQESVLAYEAGFKLSLADRAVQLNGAAFYYDYRDKQVRGNVRVPVFNILERLINVPKSRITGGELQLLVVPVSGLTFNGSVTYLDTKIVEYSGLNSTGTTRDFAGERIPYTPKWQANADVEYRFPVGTGLEAYFGGNVTYNSATYSDIGAPAFARIRPFTVIDVRAGFGAEDGTWTVSAYGRNITDEYYWNNAFASQDVTVRYAAKPVTYGVKLAYRFR